MKGASTGQPSPIRNRGTNLSPDLAVRIHGQGSESGTNQEVEVTVLFPCHCGRGWPDELSALACRNARHTLGRRNVAWLSVEKKRAEKPLDLARDEYELSLVEMSQQVACGHGTSHGCGAAIVWLVLPKSRGWMPVSVGSARALTCPSCGGAGRCLRCAGHGRVFAARMHFACRPAPAILGGDELGPNHFDRRDKEKIAQRLIRRLEDLGLKVEVKAAA